MASLQGVKLSLTSFRQFNPKYSANIFRKLSSDPTKSNGHSESLRQMDHVPSTYDKYLLVWTKKYPSMNEVPPVVPQKTMENARNISRVRINIIVCAMAGVGFILMIYLGKKAAKRGQNVTQANLDWHQMHNQNKK